jgi:PAP2 superfamily protein
MNVFTSREIERRLLLGALICAILLISGYFALVSSAWGHEFDDDGFLARRALSPKIIRLDHAILDRVNKAALLAAATVLLIIAIVRRCSLVGLIAVAGIGCSVLGAEILKNVLPWQALVSKDFLLERNFHNNTYPSGHTTIGTSLVLGLLLVSSSRWRHWLAVAGGSVSSAFATGVLFAGWHRPSDAIGALVWSGFCMSITAAFAIRLRGRPRAVTAQPDHAVSGSLALAMVVAAATWLIATAAVQRSLYAELPFFALTGLMIGMAFALIVWYAWELRAIDWGGR